MSNFIERLKICWYVLTKRNYVYFGLGNNAFVFDKDGHFVETKLNKIASYSSIQNMTFITEDDNLIPLKDFIWSGVSDFAEKQINPRILPILNGQYE